MQAYLDAIELAPDYALAYYNLGDPYTCNHLGALHPEP